MLDWLKRKKVVDPPQRYRVSSAASSEIKTALSIQEEDDYLLAETCECGGAFQAKSRKSNLDSGRTTHLVRAECDVCYQSRRFTFLYEGGEAIRDEDSSRDDEFDYDSTKREPRDHHYTFAHRALPAAVFADPRAFFQVISTGQSQTILNSLWHRIGQRSIERVTEGGSEPALKISSHSFFGRRSVLIGLPTPIATPEAWFIAVISEDEKTGDTCRYLVLENTYSQENGPQAVLCEWFEDGSRQNHKQTVLPTLENMTVAVDRVLDLETRRRRANMRADVGRRWRPGVPSSEPDEFESGTFRKSLCLFAFKHLPNLIRRDFAGFAAHVTDGSATKLVQQLWSETVGEVGADGRPAVERTTLGKRDFAIVIMPEPLAPPEPYSLGLLLTNSAAEPCGRIYSMEMASEDANTRPFFCHLDAGGVHGIVGAIPLCNSVGFAQLMELSALGQLPALDTGDVLMHLTRYSEIDSEKD